METFKIAVIPSLSNKSFSEECWAFPKYKYGNIRTGQVSLAGVYISLSVGSLKSLVPVVIEI